MKFIISTPELNYLISKCQNIVPAKPAMPVLANILLEAKDGMITLTATDLVVGIRCSAEAKVLEEGATTLPAKKFASLIRELTASTVEITTDANHQTEILAGTSRFKLMGMDNKGYPLLPNLDEASILQTNQNALKERLYHTSFAVSREDSRYALTGVCLTVSGDKATFVGTDGKRLARSYMPLDVDPGFSSSYIIPIKAVEEIVKNLQEEGTVTLYLMKDKLAVEANDTLIVSQLLAGDYPNIDRVIPSQVETSVTLHREELSTLLRQVALFVKEDSYSVRFTLGNGELKLSANNMDVGEGRVSMPANYHGQKLEIAFNPTYFLDILRHCKGETVLFGATDGFNPGVIMEGEGAASISPQGSPLFVLMPLRLNEV